MTLKSIVATIATGFVLLFAGVWLVIAWRLFKFVPTDTQKTLPLTDAVISTAGYLATTVGAGTAAVLGITITKIAQESGTSLQTAVGRVTADAPLVAAGVMAYAVVGAVILLTWLANAGEAPDLVKAFALGVLGWAGGAFGAIFKAAG